jgi:hypothetical protein
MTASLQPHTNPAAVPVRTIGLLAFVALASLGVGCSANAGVTSADLLMSEDTLSQVGLADVESASSSCEDLLGGVTDFAVLGETGLVVGLDATGIAVCIDTVEAVNSELAEDGRASDALALAARYEATMALRGPRGPLMRRIALGGDPDPEPNSPQYSQHSRPGI